MIFLAEIRHLQYFGDSLLLLHIGECNIYTNVILNILEEEKLQYI